MEYRNECVTLANNKPRVIIQDFVSLQNASNELKLSAQIKDMTEKLFWKSLANTNPNQISGFGG